jgi:hypothetical protein
MRLLSWVKKSLNKGTYDISAGQAHSALAFDPGRHDLVHIVGSVFVSLIFSSLETCYGGR